MLSELDLSELASSIIGIDRNQDKKIYVPEENKENLPGLHDTIILGMKESAIRAYVQIRIEQEMESVAEAIVKQNFEAI